MKDDSSKKSKHQIDFRTETLEILTNCIKPMINSKDHPVPLYCKLHSSYDVNKKNIEYLKHSDI